MMHVNPRSLHTGHEERNLRVMEVMASFYDKAEAENAAAAKLEATVHVVAAIAYLEAAHGPAMALRILAAAMQSVQNKPGDTAAA